MNSNLIQQSFTHSLQQWTIKISLTENFASRIQICIQSESRPDANYKGELSDLDLSQEIENITQDMAGNLYKYLYEENTKNLRIFNFVEEERILKIANRRDKKVIYIDMEKYVGNKVQEKMNVQKIRNTKSVRISTVVQSSMKMQKSTNSQQKLMRVKQNQEEKIKQLQQQQDDQQLDYQSWLNSDENNDQQQKQQQINMNKNSNIIPNYRQQPIDRNYRFEQVKSEIFYDEPQSKIFIQTQFNQFKIEELMVQNQQLKKEKVQLLERITLLERENIQLKKNVQNIDFSRKEKLNPTQKTYQSSYKAPQSILCAKPINNQDEYVYLEAKKTQSQKIIQKKNQIFQTKLHTTTIKNNHSTRKDEWIQQFQNTKRPPQQSSLFKNFDSLNGVLDISFKNFTLKQFQEHFFPFNWSCVKKLNIDGNKLGSIGFMKLSNYHFPQLQQISAGYNLIKQIQSLQNFQSLKVIDLRANPLNEETKFYLKKFSMIKNIQILI